MTPQEEIRLAGEARQMLDSAIFQAARKNVEEQLANVRRTVPIRDTDMHTRVVLMEQLWNTLSGYFEQLAQTGKMVEMELRKKEWQDKLKEQGLAMFRSSGRNTI